MAKKRRSPRKPKNPYFPCELVEYEDSFSVILTKFHYFDDHLRGPDTGGYAIEKLARQLAKAHKLKGVKFDSEASMFCAYASEAQPLLALCELLRQGIGDEDQTTSPSVAKPKISYKAARKLLRNGFLDSLNRKAQDEYLSKVPPPPLNRQQAELMRLLRDGTDSEKIKAARKINSESRSLLRSVDHYLSHPATITQILACCDSERSHPGVFREIIWALVFICDRHLPDRRTAPCFESCLESKDAQTRILGLWGLRNVGALTEEMVQPLLEDKSKKVPDEPERIAEWAGYARDFDDWWCEEER